MDKNSLIAFMEDIKAKMFTMLLETGGIGPVAFFITGKQVAVLPLSFSHNDEKALAKKAIQLTADKLEAEAVVFASEVYLAIASRNENLIGTMPVSEMPNRKVCTMVEGSTRDCSVALITEIIRKGVSIDVGMTKTFHDGCCGITGFMRQQKVYANA